MSGTLDTPLIELSEIAKSYGSVRALRGVSLQLRPGEVHALLGQNGAGKSTLIKVLAGAVRPDEGQISKRGLPLAFTSPSDAIHAGVAVVHQELTLLPHLTVWQNVTAGAPPRRLGPFVAKQRSRDAARATLDRLGVAVPLEMSVGNLPLAQQQLVEIARALHLGGGVFVLDEPNSALANAETERLLQIVRGLADDGHSVLLVSHRLKEVFSVADRVTVLRDGSVVLMQGSSELDINAAVAQMIGRGVTQDRPETPAVAGSERSPVLELSSFTAHGFDPIDLVIGHGEIVGLAGLQASGAEETLQALGGLGRTPARVAVDGRPRVIRRPVAAIRHGLVFVPPDRKEQGLWLDRSVEQNLVAGRLAEVSRAGVVRKSAVRRLASLWMERLGIRSAGLHSPSRSLSGGNQQRVMLGRSLAMEPRVLLLNEPTRGVDVGAKADIHKRLRDLTTADIAVCVTSSEIAELLLLADRLVCFRGGRIVAEGNTKDFDETSVLAIIGGRQ
jgi:rhamnose transport system ATP-binding protein